MKVCRFKANEFIESMELSFTENDGTQDGTVDGDDAFVVVIVDGLHHALHRFGHNTSVAHIFVWNNSNSIQLIFVIQFIN